MKMESARRCLILLPLLALVLVTTPLSARTPEEEELRYRVILTEDLRLLYYDEAHAYVTPHLARCFENAFSFHKKLFGYTPSEAVTIGLQDFDDHGYAGTTAIPYNFITLGIEPFEYVYDTCPTNERMNWVMNHELVHVVCCDQAAPADRFFRTIFFGKVVPTDEDPLSMFYSYLTNPRYYSPRWYHEGIATFMETWMAGGLGRSQSGYDEMTFRTMVRDGSYFYDVVGLESEGTTVDFQTGQNSYLYGTRFVSYLAHKYGPERVIDWFRRDGGTRRYFSSDFRRVFGTPLDDEWSNWIEWEHMWQSANLDSIRKYPVTQCRPLSGEALGSVSRAFFDPDRRTLYAAVRYPGEYAHVAAIDMDTGAVTKLCEIPTPAMYYVSWLAYDPDSSTVFYTTDNARRWRDLHALDIRTGRSSLLAENCRIGDLAFNRADGSLWGVQHHEGKSRLVRFPPPYKHWQEVLVLRYGKDMFDIDISPDGEFLTASLVEISGRQRLIRMSMTALMSWDPSYDVLWEFEDNAPANFAFSPDGRYLFGTSYYTGASNVFRYDFETGQMEAVTNCETGFFRPVPVSADSLIVFEYTGNGFMPVMIENGTLEDVSAVRYLGRLVAEEHPLVKEWMLGSPAEVDLDAVTVYRGDYRGLTNIRLASAYPIVEGYKDFPAYGMRFNLTDPCWLHSLTLAYSYTPNDPLPEDEKSHLRASYRHGRWTVTGAVNRADFYDLFGPTKASRKGYSVGVSFRHTFIDDAPHALNLGASVAKYGGLERLPDAQNIDTSYDHFYSGNAELVLSSLDGTIGGVEAEKGFMARLATSDTYVLEEHKVKVRTDLNYGLPLPLDHSSIWLLTSFGYSFGEVDDSFSNFYFGGFGNNWIDSESINRYRRYYSFPGMDLNSVAGTTYAKGTLEWSLPPLRFKRLGFPALYANWAHVSLFTSGIATNLDNDYYSKLANVGAQLNLKLVIFSSLSSTFSVGHAIAFEQGWAPEREFMISLNILN
ncbi:MAG: hypothetical protein JXB46_04175 [Candidatus Eisenbacteria bacterium]|nr:hypothetical protein [Candidatus Eisenbacteria bacterium]